jgi:plastocyanin
MIWLWLTCFSLMVAPSLPAATLTGRVSLRDSKEKDVERERNYAGVVVWVEPTAGHAPQPASPAHAVMQQKNKRFTPHVLAVRTGTVVDFPNLDPIFHNAFSSFSGQIFDIGLYKPGSSRGVAFNRAGVVRVFCNIHAAMSAVIVVINSPWYATTEKDGTFQIAGIPPGEYRLHVFHERATAAELAKLERTLSISTSDPPPLDCTISESGFLPAPHLNKHGKPYRPGDEDYKVIP